MNNTNQVRTVIAGTYSECGAVVPAGATILSCRRIGPRTIALQYTQQLAGAKKAVDVTVRRLIQLPSALSECAR